MESLIDPDQIILSSLVFNLTFPPTTTTRRQRTYFNIESLHTTETDYLTTTIKANTNYRTIRDSGGNYYVAGVLFMISVIGLLLYVNLYYEYCFQDTCIQMSKWRFCCFIKYFLKYNTTNTSGTSPRTVSNSNTLHNNNIKAITPVIEQANLIDKPNVNSDYKKAHLSL